MEEYIGIWLPLVIVFTLGIIALIIVFSCIGIRKHNLKTKYRDVYHTDVIVNKYTGHHAISYAWVVNDYYFKLQEYGELNVPKEDYQNYKIGDTYTWVTKEKIRK